MNYSVHSHIQSRQFHSPHTRARLITELRSYGVQDERVLGQMASVPRHEFVDQALQSQAYRIDATLPIGHSQTISQPRVVAVMTEALLKERPRLRRVLEIGTGSGYQTAILAGICETVYTVERIKALTEVARLRLAAFKIKNVHFGYADGHDGMASFAPFDGIIVTAGALVTPPALLAQLALGGRMVIPVGPAGQQSLKVYTRDESGFTETTIATVSFVPLLSGKS